MLQASVADNFCFFLPWKKVNFVFSLSTAFWRERILWKPKHGLINITGTLHHHTQQLKIGLLTFVVVVRPQMMLNDLEGQKRSLFHTNHQASQVTRVERSSYKGAWDSWHCRHLNWIGTHDFAWSLPRNFTPTEKWNTLSSDHYKKGIEKLKDRWTRCIELDRDYIE